MPHPFGDLDPDLCRRAVPKDGAAVILVGVDGGVPSLRALAYALGLARRQGAWLVAAHVMAVVEPSGLYPYPYEAVQSAGRGYAADLRRSIHAQALDVGVPMSFVSVEGAPCHELTRLSERYQAELLIVGAPAHWWHRLFGSVGSRLARTRRWPVVIVP